HLPPLSSKTTAQLLRKPSEPPYPQPLASEKMKSGTRSFFTASPPPPHSVQSSLRLHCRYNHSERKNHTKFFAEPPPHWLTTISHHLNPSLHQLLKTNH